MARKTYYQILKVASTATRQEIRKAYRFRAAECHPDKVMHLSDELQDRARRKMTLINEAYGILGTEAKRQEYDEYLALLEERRKISGEPPLQTAPPPRPSKPTPKPSSPPKAPPPPPSVPPSQAGKDTLSRAMAPESSPPSEPLSRPPSGVIRPSVPPGSAAEANRPPPPELTGSELLQALERAIQRIADGINETNPQATFQKGAVPGFDLSLHGATNDELLGMYVSSHDRLESSSLASSLTKVTKAASTVPLDHRSLTTALLVLCLKYEDREALERQVRDHNQGQLAGIRRRKGRTTMAGILHIPTGALYFPYSRTIGLDISYLSDVGSRY